MIRADARHALAAAALWVAVPLAAQNKPTLTPDDYGKWETLGAAAISPDGAWIAYSEGDFSGPSNVFVRRADGSGGRTQISVGGGKKPHWTKGGREIVFQKGNGLYAVDVDAPSDVVGVPTMLFEGSYNVARGYDVTADGSRFLIVKPEKRPEALPILVIMNFFEELKAKVGGN